VSEHSQKSRDKCAASCALGSAVVSYLVCSFAISTILLLFIFFWTDPGSCSNHLLTTTGSKILSRDAGNF
jgi:hypothetical protein